MIEIDRIQGTIAMLFGRGRVGLRTNRKNVLMILRCVELLRLSINRQFRVEAIYMDDRQGLRWIVRVLTVAGAEASVGLAVLVVYYRVHGSLAMSSRNVLHG